MSNIFKFWFCLFCIAETVCGNERFSIVPNPHVTAFRRMGSLVDGVAHAHIALNFDLKTEAQAVKDLGEDLNKISKNTSLPMWAPVVHEITPMEADWSNFRKELKDNFFPHHRERRQVAVGLALGAVVVASAGAGAFALERDTRA